METETLIAQIKFDAQGLVPAIVQDWTSGEVLTLAYMNAESLGQTLKTGETVFWSRSRQQLWHKGESSGHTQQVKSLRYDCDADAIVVLVAANGPACHTGERSCFYRALSADGPTDPQEQLAPFEVLPDLERTVAARKLDDDQGGSYTAALLNDPKLTGAKVQEEAEEVVRAVSAESDERVANEAADVLYHLTVLLATRNLTLADAQQVLNARRGAPRRFTAEDQQ